jgi:hypothetical protein
VDLAGWIASDYWDRGCDVAQTQSQGKDVDMILTWFIVIALMVIGWIAWPVLRKTIVSEPLQNSMQDPIAYLESQKEMLYQSIRELDFDFETGKLSKQDYQDMRAKIEHDTIDVMKQMDRAKAKWATMEKDL